MQGKGRFGCVNARQMFAKMKFARARLCVVVVYVPCNDRSVNGKEKF